MGGKIRPRSPKIPDGIWHVSVESLEDFERVHWNDKTQLEKAAHVIAILIKLSLLVLTLIIFLLTLALLSTAFQLVGGRGIGSIIKSSSIIQNPICAACMGMLVTVVLQSSSTLSSVLVAMVAGHLLKVREAIPILMGSEVGASFMNAFIGLGQSGDRAQFRRAFAAVALGDIYNYLCFFILLALEIQFAPIQALSKLMVSPIRISHKSSQEYPSLTILTDPLLDRIIQVDFDALDDALEDELMEPGTVMQESFIERCVNLTTLEEFDFCSHSHLFAYSTLDDTSIAIILLVASIVSLILTTLIIVKLITMLLEGKLAIVLKEWLDKKLPSPFRWTTDYMIMILSCGLVMIIQSSNVIQSALTPLVGMGVVPLERLFPLILGSGIGASITGILTAFSADPGQLKDTLQMAFCQTIYNFFGMLLFFPVSFIRRMLIRGAMVVGQKTAKYRWLALIYILVVFFLIPIYMLAISFLPRPFMIAAIIATVIFWVTVILINYLQANFRKQLPKCLRNWDCLPEFLHSCKPIDTFLTKKFSRKAPRNNGDTGRRLTTVEKLIQLTIQTQV